MNDGERKQLDVQRFVWLRLYDAEHNLQKILVNMPLESNETHLSRPPDSDPI